MSQANNVVYPQNTLWEQQAKQTREEAEVYYRLQSRLQSGGGGGIGGGMEARVAKLESDVENIKENIMGIKIDIRDMRQQVHDNFNKVNEHIRDNSREVKKEFRWVLGIIISIHLVLFGSVFTAIAKGFGWL